MRTRHFAFEINWPLVEPNFQQNSIVDQQHFFIFLIALALEKKLAWFVSFSNSAQLELDIFKIAIELRTKGRFDEFETWLNIIISIVQKV